MQILTCRKCSKKLRYPENKRVKFTCPHCNTPYHVGSDGNVSSASDNKKSDKAQNIINDVFARLILSFVAFIGLVAVYGFDQFGVVETVLIVILHGVSIYFLKQGNDGAKKALWLTILWNTVVLIYILYGRFNDDFGIDPKRVGSEVAGLLYLLFSYGRLLVKLERA